MEKLKMHSLDKLNDNILKIGKLFPNCLTERRNEHGEIEYAIDFDVLRQELSKDIVEGNEERYQFTWPDKKNAMRLANLPINKTLRPCREESVDFDTTQNLYIEGDNLEVLKLLQETYLGKIKMIYIDPPYNTGNDFVYEDDFSQSAEEYFANSGQQDEEGNRLVQNTESNGRFHTDWLNMMYPRLKLAKDLLSDDGVICISMDDNEVENLKKICNEIFGESNFVSQICLVNNIAGRSDSKHIARAHEYILVYQKSTEFVSGGMPLTEEQMAEYRYVDGNGNYRLQGLRKRGSGARREDRPNMFYPVYYNEITGEVSLQCSEGSICITPKLSDGTDGRWRWGKDTFNKNINRIEIKVVAGRGEFDVYERVYLNSDGEMKTAKLKSFLLDALYTSDNATSNFRTLMNNKVFESPKAIKLITDLIRVGNIEDEMVLDFFSGSATTAHAVMQLNAEDGGKRKFIMVQLPETCDEKSEAYKAGYKNICEIGKERIRRAGAKIKADNPLTTQDLDIGFRVLKCDTSNMKDVYYTPNEYTADLFDTLADNIKEDRTAEDLLFQVMLDLGVVLSSKIESLEIGGKQVFNVENGYLLACFENNLTDDVIMEIAKMQPYYFMMRDSSMADDSVAANFEQIFNTYSPNTVRRVL